jgi:four helix bundle protein
MAPITKFEDIKAWQKARKLTNKIYQITERGKFIDDFTLQNQIKKASISIMLNIAEGFARKSDREFKQFLIYAHGSCAEVQSALYIALDQKYIFKETV